MELTVIVQNANKLGPTEFFKVLITDMAEYKQNTGTSYENITWSIMQERWEGRRLAVRINWLRNQRSLIDEQRKLYLAESYNKADIFLGLIDYELNSLLVASHLADYISVHIRFDLERYLLKISTITDEIKLRFGMLITWVKWEDE